MSNSTVNTISKSDSGSAKVLKNPNSINDLIGEWGTWQARTVFLIFLCKIPAAWFMACIIYTAPFAEYGEFDCQQPTINNSRPQIEHERWLSIAHPIENNQYDFCNVYANLTERIDNDTVCWQSGVNVVPCENFEHHSVFKSLVTQFDLVCSRKILVAVTQFSHLCGVLFGGITATKLLEVLSPRYVMLTGMITQIVCGCITGLVNEFWLHTFFRLLSAMCCALMYTAGLMIFSDITGGKYRKSVICLFESFWGVGVVILPFIALALPAWSWSMIYIAISLPTIAYILLWPLIPDSPKWLLAHGRVDAAKDCLLYAIQVNDRKTKLPTNFDHFLQMEVATIAKQPEPEGWLSLWSDRKEIIKMCALHTAWAVDVTNYNGMLLNIRVFGRQFLALNTVISGCCKISGVLIAWFIVMNIKEHKFHCSGIFNIVAGVLSFLGFAFPDSISETAYISIGVTLAMISIMATTCSQAVLFTCTAELVPTTKQKICIFSCVVWARIWLLTAPFIGALTFLHNLFPLAAFGFIELCGGICSCIIGHMHAKSTIQSKIEMNNIRNSVAGNRT